MQTPKGLDQIKDVFGDVHTFALDNGTLSPTWESLYLDHATLPFNIPLDWNRATVVSRMLCHKLLVEVFEQVFEDIQQQGLAGSVETYGGCFMYRAQRTGRKLSTHAWGIAIDLNPSTNQQGTMGNMDPNIVRLFKSAGFEWGGDWESSVRDPMHFQFATGY